MISLQVYIVCLGLVVLITAGLAYRAFFESHRPSSRTFGFLLSTMTIWAFFYLLEIVLSDISQKIVARKIAYLGMTLSAPFWFAFALRYTRFSEWWSQRRRNALLIIPGMAAFLFGLSNELHHFIWQTIKTPMNNDFGELVIIYGTGFWIYTTISYVFIAGGVFIYLYNYIRSPKHFRAQTGIMLAGVLATLIVSIIFLANVLPINIDPTPLSFLLSAPLLAHGFFRFGVFNLFPIAAPLIIENLRDAVIVTDETDHIININFSASKWFKMSKQTIGVLVFEILPKANLFKERWDVTDARIKFKIEDEEGRTWYDATITRLYKNDTTLLGRVIVFRNITQEQELLEAEFGHSTRMGLLEEVGRQIADSLTEQEVLNISVNTIINHFGYAETAISLLTEENKLEVAAVAGTQDFGYKPSFKQEMGAGIIGHTAEIRKTYIANEVADDPYYFSSDARNGSAICIPLTNEKTLLGVLYIESAKPNAFNTQDAQTLETLSNHIASAVQRARLYASVREHLKLMSAVQSISQVISSSLDMEKICQAVVKTLNSSFGYACVSIYLLEGEYLKLGGQIGYPAEMVIEKIHVGQGISGQAVKTKQTQYIPDVTADINFLRASPDVTSEICVPLLKDGNILGILNVEGHLDSPLTQKDADMLTTLAAPIALAVDNARLHAQVKILAMTDIVSGLFNRRAFEETLRTEIERASRSNVPLSLIIFDLDSFKDYNDAWGHPAGDTRLKATGDLIHKNLRKYDVAARYGGDEFAIILPDTDQEGSLVFAKRLLAAAQASVPEELIVKKFIAGYTLSIGIATFPYDGSTFETLILAADHAELIAKRLGKNQIFIARDLDK